MGRLFVKRTYQWIFDKRGIKYFSDTIEEAVWIIDKNSFSIKRKSND